MNEAFRLGPQDWALLRSLLDEALSLPERERQAWLHALHEPRVQSLKPRLEALLAHAAGGDAWASAHRLLETLPKVETQEFAPLPAAATEKPGDTVGPYRLVRELGSGGMGSVWLAERDDMLQGRQVALKLPHGAWKRAGLAERLAREREILATLEHPNIARLYDAGLADGGQPWLALEYVAGERIDVHCRARDLSVRQRLGLFLQVARAVAHAHAQLVVHRDLKPANILVTEAGEVKLLDFGIAKLLQEGVVEETELTRKAGRALTPEYASPEQILGRPIGTASDIYSLGVVLFELLADERPYRLPRRSPAALEEAIVQQDLPRPSARAPPERRRALRGDLDTIVLKALKRDPAERYATVVALADDIERHLDERPVLAQPDRAWYRVAKFVRRHRVPVGVAAALLAALLAGLAGTAWQARVARGEQQRAEAVKTFVAGLFTDANPFNTKSSAPTVEALLQSAEERLERAADGGPAVRVELLLMIGTAYHGLSRFDRAELLFGRAIAEARRGLGEAHPLTLRARLAMVDVHRFRGRRSDMKTELDALLPVLRDARTREQRDLLLGALMASSHLAIDEGGFVRARDLAQEATALSTDLYGAQHAMTADTWLLQATVAHFMDDGDTTLRLTSQARDLVVRLHGTDRPHAKVLETRMLHGRALDRLGRYREARAELEEVLAQVRQLMGPDAAMVGYLSNDLARIALELGDEPAALRHARAMLTILQRDSVVDSPTMGTAWLQFGRALLAVHRAEEARVAFERAQRGISAARGADAPLALDAATLHAAALAQLDRPAEAWQLLGPRLAGYRTARTVVRYRGLHVAGIVKRLQGDLAAAAALQEEALAALPDNAAQRPRRNHVLGERARVALEQGDAQAALAWLDRVVRPEGSAAQSLEEATRQVTRGRALLAAGQASAAAEVLRQADSTWRALAPDAAVAPEATRWLAQALAAMPSK